MSHYYATIIGARAPRTAQGSKNSGIRTAAQTYDGSIIVGIDHDAHTDTDVVTISTAAGSTASPERTLLRAPLDLLIMVADHLLVIAREKDE